MKRAYNKDIWRAIWKGKKRFFAIMIITILGVAMFSGLKAACVDLRHTADEFLDEQKLYDINVVSTLGLTLEDVEALAALESVQIAEGAYSETVHMQIDGGNCSAVLKTLSEAGMNEPYVLEGELPRKADEIAVTIRFAEDTAASVGDILTIEEDLAEDEEPNFLYTEYEITAIVIDPMDLNNSGGAVSFRSSSTEDYTMFIRSEAVASEVYTAIYLTLDGARDMFCYGEAYEAYIAAVTEQIELDIKEVREQARYDAVINEAKEELADAEEEAEAEFTEAKEELAKAEAELLEAKEELADAERELREKERQAEAEFAKARAELAYARQQLNALTGGVGESELALTGGAAGLSEQETALINAETELAQKEAEVNRQLANGYQEIAEAKQELEDGEAELADGWAEYEEKKAEVEQELEDARKEIEDIDMAQWYVQERTSLSGYANVKSDADSIESIGTVFPIVFFVVAILISLTTITRMVEEDRGLIGTYKALGFTDREIRRKYLLYASAASAMGSIIGTICAFLVLPGIIFVIFGEMYLLPDYVFLFDPTNGILGPVIFMTGIVGATAIACKAELLQMPAVLMRPKAPRSGSRVFLERVKPVWNQLSFLNKVTARNLFRYKKRLFMTIAGIMGCMALLLFGFAIKDSVTDLMPRQYEQVYRYDLMAVTTPDDNEKLLSYVENDKEMVSFLNAQIENVQLKSAAGEEKVQLIVIPKDADIDRFIGLERLDGEPVTLKAGGIYITRNAADVLEFDEGDTVAVQRLDLSQRQIQVTAIVKNYLGNNIYMTQTTYEELFGAYEPNGILAELSESCTNQRAYAQALGEKDGVLTSMSTQELKADFSQAFTLINMVVYIVIIMAAALAFVVLFTLSTTNISERQRELATIKVLGFYDREVHLYVNKETLILTGVGILLGIPLGYAFAQTLTVILRIPSIYLAVSLHKESYLIAAGISGLFALIVNTITDRSLDRVDPVEALKSIE